VETGRATTYDQENRIATATKNGVTTTNTYDDDGNRVEKTGPSGGTLYWYMSPGIVAESDLSGNLQSEYVFFDGERVARKDFPGPRRFLLLLRPPEDRLGHHRPCRQHQVRIGLFSVRK
jgi:YD repeat-containing protein